MTRALPPGYWNSFGGRPPEHATAGLRNGRRWNRQSLDGTDLGDVVVVRHGYDQFHVVRCKAAGHEYPTSRSIIKRHVEQKKPLACRDCGDEE